VSAPDDTFARIDMLVQVGLRLARSAPSGRLLLARIADTIDPEWIPQPWGKTVAGELTAARERAAEALDFDRVEAVLRDAWDARAALDELDDLDPTPAAITPAAQVHRGVLDGAPVAVKVLRPGLRATVRQDLGLVEGMLAPLGAAFPSVDPAAIVREFRERILDELDLEHEATAMRRFHRALRSHPYLSVPAPVTRLAHENVLVSEWVDGVPLTQAPDLGEACSRLVTFVIGAARFGFIHADPDPRDVLVRPDGRLAILDFGATRAVERDRLDRGAAALEAFVAEDAAAFGAATAALGVLPAEHAPTVLRLAREVLGEFAGPEPVRLDSDAVLVLRDRLDRQPDTVAELLLAGSMPPEDLWSARGTAQLFSTIARVGATGPWRELVRAALRDGWDPPND
jgi:predicted unusual protein kinase regulating ubiquinone biosynthesis (AarF/ABC1/UbiB family)